MKAISLVMVMFLLAGAAWVATAQNTCNTWSSGAPMPVAVAGAAVGLLKGKIYVVTGWNGTTRVTDTQIYDPATNTWSTGAPLPEAVGGPVGAVVNGVLYVIGGSTGNDISTCTNKVWAYYPGVNKWFQKSPMPTPRRSIGAAVENGLIYVIGGNGKYVYRLDTVESYNPATDSWTEEAPLLHAKSEPSVGLVGTTIVAADGYLEYGTNGDNEAYDAATNTWTQLASDPSPRNADCSGAIGGRFYVAGDNRVNESFNLSENTWKNRAPVPQSIWYPGSAVYKGQLYCFGGEAYQGGPVINNVQIYQP